MKKNYKFVAKDKKTDIEESRKSLTYWQDVWRRLRKNRMSMFGLIVVMGIVLFGVIGPLFTDFTFADQANELRNLPPKLDVYEIEDNVFIGPNATFTNDKHPRSKVYPETFLRTLIKKGASIGANATILPGIEIGEHSVVGAGAVVTKSIPPYAVVMGNPAKIIRFLEKSND